MSTVAVFIARFRQQVFHTAVVVLSLLSHVATAVAVHINPSAPLFAFTTIPCYWFWRWRYHWTYSAHTSKVSFPHIKTVASTTTIAYSRCSWGALLVANPSPNPIRKFHPRTSMLELLQLGMLVTITVMIHGFLHSLQVSLVPSMYHNGGGDRWC